MRIGFDPSFVDIFVQLHDAKGNLIPALPPIGHHHRNCKTDEMAGGNGVNVARTLRRLGRIPSLVVPIDEIFSSLVKKDPVLSEIHLIKIPSVSSNRTIALFTSNGEIQLNSVTNSLGKENWSIEINGFWTENPLWVFLNWGLNPLSHEWVSCQILSIAGYSIEEIHEIDEQSLVDTALKVEIPKTKPILLDTGLIKEHPKARELEKLRKKLAGSKETIIIVNKEEAKELNLDTPANFIIHTSEKVIVKSPQFNLSVSVPPLPEGERNFVGAGDAFLAAIIDSFLSGNEILTHETINHGIRVAQNHILNYFGSTSS